MDCDKIKLPLKREAGFNQNVPKRLNVVKNKREFIIQLCCCDRRRIMYYIGFVLKYLFVFQSCFSRLINFVFINIINVLSNSSNVKTILIMFQCFFDLSSFVDSMLCSADWGSNEPQGTNIILKKFIKNLLNVNLSSDSVQLRRTITKEMSDIS